MGKYSQNNGRFSKEAEIEGVALMLLGLFWKYQVLPSFIAPMLIDKKYMQLYKSRDNIFQYDVPFIKLTMRGRKFGERTFRIFLRSAREEGRYPKDPYLNLASAEYTSFLMHHRRFEQEFRSGKDVRLMESYALEFHALLG